MDPQYWSALVGMLFFLMSYLVVRPIQVSLTEAKDALKELKLVLEQIRSENSAMKSDIASLNEKINAAFKCIDVFRDELQSLKHTHE